MQLILSIYPFFDFCKRWKPVLRKKVPPNGAGYFLVRRIPSKNLTLDEGRLEGEVFSFEAFQSKSYKPKSR